jgi:nucleotide-binding universal stress UspA family protein
VDGSPQNRSAVDWAVAEAVRAARELVIVMAASSKRARRLPFFSAHHDTGARDSYADVTVGKLESALRLSHPTLQVRALVEPGDATGLILETAEGAAMTVVGKRGLGAIGRLMVGSTSLAVAGRNQAPTIIVPERWNLVSTAGRPIVVGLDVNERDERSLEFGFARANELGVRVVALYGWQPHPAFTLSEDDRLRWGEDALRAMHETLRPWEEKYPDVVLEVMQRHEHPAIALLEKADMAQLVVLGRHTAPDHLGGFALGSVDRAVLHYSTTPVAVVPER